ncbi:hypothetical protein GGR03_002129 [Aurantimonas endophytica]|uniref:Uncharacterized protein n=1 Tax=Aurantimonas endophytica TaxID=1522175 RepID=A0A7W6HD73_9HYPH|nr:hypothetical protein [Aurantimonas endophytica]
MRPVDQSGPARHRRPHAVLEEERCRVGVAGERPCVRRQDQRRVPVDLKPFPGKRDRGHQQILPGLLAEALMRHTNAVDEARYRDGRGAFDIAVAHDRFPRKQVRSDAFAGERIVGGVERCRRTHAVVDAVGFLLGFPPDHHGTATGRPAHPRLDHAQGKGGGYGGIQRVTAVGKHGGASLRGEPALRRDDAAGGSNRRLADRLRAGKRVHRDGRPPTDRRAGRRCLSDGFSCNRSVASIIM